MMACRQLGAPGVVAVAGEVTAGPSSGALSSPDSRSPWPEGARPLACPLERAITEPLGVAGDAALPWPPPPPPPAGLLAAGCDSPFPSLACGRQPGHISTPPATHQHDVRLISQID